MVQSFSGIDEAAGSEDTAALSARRDALITAMSKASASLR